MLKNKKAQATAEIAIFGSLMLLVLGVLLNYTRSIREQQEMEQQVFRQALNDVYNYNFTVTDVNGQTQTDYGATISYSKTQDKQAGVIFEPNRRSYAAGYSVFWSGAEDSPEINKNEINRDALSIPHKKLTYFRSSDAEETPDKEMNLSTWDAVALIGPVMASAIGSWTNWFGDYAAAVNLAARLASFAYFSAKIYAALDEMKDVESRIKSLEAQDKQFQEWGWRVSTKVKDSADGIAPGQYYVKEIDAQIYDTRFDASTQYVSTENKNEDASNTINKRRIVLADATNRNFSLRYDITTPDSTIDLANHAYEYLPDVALNQGLGQNATYSSADVGGNLTQGQIWTTPH